MPLKISMISPFGRPCAVKPLRPDVKVGINVLEVKFINIVSVALEGDKIGIIAFDIMGV